MLRFRVAALTVAVLAASAAAQAQSQQRYPQKPIRLVVAFSAEVLPGFGRDGSQGWLAPAGTPRPILNQINKEIARILALPEVKERLLSYDFHIAPTSPEEYDRILRADIDTFRKVAAAAGVTPK